MGIFQDSTVFQAIQQRAAISKAQKKEILNNINHQHEAGFKASHVKEIGSFKAALKSAGKLNPSTLKKTNAAHLTSHKSSTSKLFKVQQDTSPDYMGMNGNTVSIEGEMLRMQEASADMKLAHTLKKSFINWVRAVLS